MSTQSAPVGIPDPAAVISASSNLAPSLRVRAAETDALHRQPDEHIADMRAAGPFRVIQPALCGGWQTNFHTDLDAIAKIAVGCGAPGLCLGVLEVHSWVGGSWLFGSDSQISDWAILGARVKGSSGETVEEGCFLIPTSVIEIRDDWHDAWPRGTGQLQPGRG